MKMNRERAKEMLPIIQAYAEGKKIEFFDKHYDEWREISDSGLGVGLVCDAIYRIKPEPRYVWLNVYGGNVLVVPYRSKESADQNVSRARTGRIKVLIEDRFDD